MLTEHEKRPNPGLFFRLATPSDHVACLSSRPPRREIVRLDSFRSLHLVSTTDGTGWSRVSTCSGRGSGTGEGGHTVDLHLAVSDDGLDHALLLEVGEALSGQRTVDLHSVDEGGDGDQAVGLDILVELLGSGLVEDDGVLGLVLDLALGPLRHG